MFRFIKSTAMRKRKLNIFSAVLSLFLLVPASITRAQKISSQKGLTTAVFSISAGVIKLYLPDDIRPGDVISCRMKAEPAGKNAKEVEKNLGEFKNYFFSLNNEKFPVDNPDKTFQFFVHPDRPLTSPIELLNVSGFKAGELAIPTIPGKDQKPAPETCMISSHALVAAPLRVTGPFDGDLTNTSCSIDNKPVEILAESPRQCILTYPADAQGLHTLTVQENGKPSCSAPVSGVDMNVSAGKLELRKREKTYIDVNITGLQNLPDKAVLTLTNVTADVVNMLPSNNVIIPLFPDTVSSGTFNQRFNIQSIQAGSFTVNVNLDLPEISATNAPTETVPPGYTKKSCECSVTAKVVRTGANGNTISFKAEANGECKGAYGVGINTFTKCGIKSTTYQWSIGSGKANATINGKNDNGSVTIQTQNNGQFIVGVKVTVTCLDGTTCEADAYADQSGTTVSGPGEDAPATETKPGKENPPTTGNPPTTTEKVKCGCDCSVSVKISQTGFKNGKMVFGSNVKKNCKLKPCPGQGTVAQCVVASTTYSWKVTAGKDVLEIDGKGDGPGVEAKIKGSGSYVIRLTVTIVCSDGSTCEASDVIEGEIPPTTTSKTCVFSWEELMIPNMDGGMKEYKGPKVIRRDEFISLGAEGRDYDQLLWICEPIKPDCKDSRSEQTIPLNGRVRFEWRITSGEGGFVKLGCLPGDQYDEGDNIIFMPPYVPLPIKSADTSLITTILLSVLDDNPTQIEDPQVDKTITITTKRSKNSPDLYTIEIVCKRDQKLPSSPPPKFIDGTCTAKGPDWELIGKLPAPTIELPDVADKDKMVLGQWIVLTTDVRDDDLVKYYCVSQAQCPTSGTNKKYQDNVSFTWTKSEGVFISDPTGRYVVYQAPQEMKKGETVIKVKIKVQAVNPDGGKRKDADSDWGEKTLLVYQPGVKLNEPDKTWLPREDNNLELKSELMYKDGVWKPALAHMCRIHFFELMNVSQEKGVCMNDPELDPKKPDACYDLQLKNENEHEAFDERKIEKKESVRNCDRKEMYFQARTMKPVKEYTMKVYSWDYGSYGFLRSFANISRGGKDSIREAKPPIYISIPWTNDNCTHAHKPARFKKQNYGDNRVTIPLDIDENHIADAGWKAEAVAVPDPVDNEIDEDDKPVGDGEKGDGLTNYEEYRGFKILNDHKADHIRTDWKVKDIFIRNVHDLNHDLYDKITGLNVHEINAAQYNGDDSRVVNFNFTAKTHVVDQMGLKLVNGGADPKHPGLLGIVCSVFGKAICDPDDAGERPAPPNWIKEVRVFADKVNAASAAQGLNLARKLDAVTTHELSHGNNVCHHGEKFVNPSESFTSYNNLHGLRSGNINCVMRYDNVGRPVDLDANPPRWQDDPKKVKPEAIGSILCDSPEGTGYNKPTYHTEKKGGVEIKVEDVHPPPGFGNTGTNRGDCQHQIRVTGKGWEKKTGGSPPKACGGREG